MLYIGLTGGMGSGKTTVANIFSVLGIPVFDADAAAKKIMTEDEDLKKSLVETFGKQTFIDGELNRKYLADIVFKDPFQLERLNALVHPATIAAAKKWMQQQNAPYVIKEATLFFESGSGADLDYIIGVYAPQSTRINRVMKRDGMDRSEVLNRMNHQLNEEIKMKLCDFVVVNDEQRLLLPQILALHEQFKSYQKG